jgi:hypothetical protein
MIWVTDANNNSKVAINPTYVVAIFTAQEGPLQGKTVISLTNGQIAVSEDDLTIVGMLQGN